MTRRPSRSLVVALLVVVGGCGADDDTVFVAESVAPATADSGTAVSETAAPTLTEPAVTESDSSVLPVITVDRAWSPENAIAQIEGVGATASDPVTVDDAPAAVESFEGGVDGFVLRVRIDDEGAHTVCARDACSRVFTLAPDADTAEEIDAKIDAAIVEAEQRFDGATRFPDWSILRAGAFGGTGGSTDATGKTISIYANRGRTVEEFTVTILHEWGHVVDIELLDAVDRAAYLELRGFDPATEWDAISSHRIEDWAASPSEDFAEVLVVAWTGGDHQVRTTAPGGQPSPDVVAATIELAGL